MRHLHAQNSKDHGKSLRPVTRRREKVSDPEEDSEPEARDSETRGLSGPWAPAPASERELEGPGGPSPTESDSDSEEERA
jgi:hypothetical protein